MFDIYIMHKSNKIGGKMVENASRGKKKLVSRLSNVNSNFSLVIRIVGFLKQNNYIFYQIPELFCIDFGSKIQPNSKFVKCKTY